MTSPTTKRDALQPEAEEAGPLFADWFDPIETALRDLQLPTSPTGRRGGCSYGFDLRLDPTRLDHVGTLKRLSTEEHDLEASQQTVDPAGKNVGNCKLAGSG